MIKTLIIILLLLLDLPAQDHLKIFISVDMEGIGGIGTPKMTRTDGGKDYETGRKLMTDEVNAVVEAIFNHDKNADILVNDSHGDMQNLYHTKLDNRVKYLQSNIKPLGMVQGLDNTFDAVIFIGYHARAGTKDGFLAHTGSGSVKGLWINGKEVGEGGLNAHFAGALGVPVILASGDETFTKEIQDYIKPLTVSTKQAIGGSAALMLHPEKVHEALKRQTTEALRILSSFKPLKVKEPVTFQMKFSTTTHADVLMSIPNMKRIDGTTVEYFAKSMDEAYRLIRIMYKYISF